MRLSLAAAILALSGGIVSGASWTALNSGLSSTTAEVVGLTVAPADPSTLYALTRSGAVFKSTDGAGSWNPVSGIANVNYLAVDPQTSSTVYAAAGSGVFKSTDGGASWHATGAQIGSVFMLAVDPLTPSTLFAVTRGHIFKSTNAGGEWREVYNTVPATPSFSPPYNAYLVAINPVTPSNVYAPLDNGNLLKSTDGGERWSVIRTAGSRGPLAIDPVTPSTLYATFGYEFRGSVSRSTDGGGTWITSRSGIPVDAVIQSLAVDPTTPSTIYASYMYLSSNGHSYGWSYGILKSVNSGQGWSAVNVGLPSNFCCNPVLAVAPGSSRTLYAAYDDWRSGTGGILKSTDQAASWTRANAGLDFFDLHVFAIDPARATSLYTGGVGGLFKSDDGGAGWSFLPRSRIELPTSPFSIYNPASVVHSLLIDFLHPSVLYFEAARRDGECSYTDRLVFKSTDGGASFSDSVSPPNSGCNLGGFTTLMAMDPGDPNTLYVAENQVDFLADGPIALLKSTDGGGTWQTVSDFTGSQTDLNALAIDSANPNILYLGVGEPTSYLRESTGTGVFKSFDGGASWTVTGLKDITVTVLAMDPSNSSVLYAGTQSIGTEPRGFRGLFQSSNGGDSWLPINNGLAGLGDIGAAITALMVAPNDSNTVYLGTSGAGVFKTTDGGATWWPLNDGLISQDVRALAVVPGASNTVYAATASGVFGIVDDASRANRRALDRR